jgi:DNA-binding CsgD family transcriptional regulator
MTEQLGTLLLELYRATRELPETEFVPFALGLARGVAEFDSARTTAVDLGGGAIVVRRARLYREPSDMVLDWSEIASRDMVLQACRQRVGTAVTFHAASLYRGPEAAVLRDYSDRYQHQNGLVQLLPDPVPGYFEGFSFYRAREGHQFSERERLALQDLIPHLSVAMQLNRQVGEQAGQAQRGRLAIASLEGALLYCGSEFSRLLRLEWPDWSGTRLPAPLLSCLAADAALSYQGLHLQVRAQLVGARLFLRVRKGYRLGQLAPREREVARLYGGGKSYKEIAQSLQLAPSTVRNVLQRVFHKLSVGSKSQLASMLSMDEAG